MKSKNDGGWLAPATAGAGMGMGMGMRPGWDGQAYTMYSPFGAELIDRHEWRHTVYLVEFMMTTDWQDKIKLGPPPEDDSAETAKEIEKLRALRTPEMLAAEYDNMIGESADFVGCFEQLAYFDAHSHPVTSGLVQTMVVIGWTLVQYYKELFGRSRPTVVDPTFEALVRVPTFPAYPSGHATQSHLIMNALQEVVPDFSPGQTLSGELTKLASRISTNRELAGVHYHLDTTAGQELARQIWQLIIKNQNFKKLIKEAKDEWDRPIQSGRKFLQHP